MARFNFRTILVAFALSLTVLGLSGCHRGSDYDDRTLAQKPHVETEYPENKRDVFRPQY
jgi:hypothetical protein